MSAQNHQRVPIWDVWVRLFHWFLVVAVAFQLFSGETGEWFFEYHKQVGEVVLGLVLFRLLWGCVGSSNARLASFLQSPLAAVRHLQGLMRGKVAIERGHNAAGGWAVIAMLVLITTQAVTGLFIADEDELIEGALYGLIGDGVTQTLYNIHTTTASILTLLIVVHVVALILYLVRAGQNLITPMMTGQMRWPKDVPLTPVTFARPWLGILCALIVAVLVYVVVR